MKSISFLLNGVQRNLTVDDTLMLLWVLRDDLGLTGAKVGCGVVGILVESDFLPARTLRQRYPNLQQICRADPAPARIERGVDRTVVNAFRRPACRALGARVPFAE